MSATVIERFQAEELAAEDPPAVATINRYVGVVRQAFRLAHKQGRLSRVPYFPMLPIDNARSGFLEPANLARLLEKLPPHLADATEFAYLTGWRKGHISKLEWEHVDRTNRLLAVPGRLIKNRRPQTIPLAGRLWKVIERRWERREVKRNDGTSFLSPQVFHRGDGKRLGEIRKTWARACREAGFAERVRPGKRTLPGLLFHDLRRSAARNLVRSGVDRNVAKKITGHKTDSMFDRYNITDTRDQEIAFERLEAHLAAAPKKTNVVPIK
jgi:integrase